MQFGDLSNHAATRCGQRGIRIQVLNLVLAHFDRDHHAGAGASAISISRRRLSELQRDGVSPELIDQAGHTVLIVADDGAIITAINRPTWFARFHYGAQRLGNRRRFRQRSQRSRSPR